MKTTTAGTPRVVTAPPRTWNAVAVRLPPKHDAILHELVSTGELTLPAYSAEAWPDRTLVVFLGGSGDPVAEFLLDGDADITRSGGKRRFAVRAQSGSIVVNPSFAGRNPPRNAHRTWGVRYFVVRGRARAVGGPVRRPTVAVDRRGDVIVKARQLEARLVRHFVATAITPNALGRPPYICGLRSPDLYFKRLHMICEAKASADPLTVRLALGQLFEYQALTRAPKPKLCMLLPGMPESDQLRALKSCGVAVIWRLSDGSFTDSRGGAVVRKLG